MSTLFSKKLKIKKSVVNRTVIPLININVLDILRNRLIRRTDDLTAGGNFLKAVCHPADDTRGSEQRRIPVSYTHLDVYKRQLREYGGSNCVYLGDVAHDELRDGQQVGTEVAQSTAASQDVYKRQAEDCGFNSASHFARAFRQETDISPTAFRAISF